MIEDLGEGGEDGMEDSIARIMGLDKKRATPEDAEIITAQAQARRNLEERQQQIGAVDYVADVAMAVPRGVVGAAQGVYNLADLLTFDILPDWDKNPLGGSVTTVGGIVETIAEFGVGFLTGSAAISAASKIGRLGKVAKAAKWMQGPGKIQGFAKATTAGAIADFSVFEGDSMRLSNLVESIPGLSNPITEFLAAKEGDVDSLANRLKNVIEGGVVGSAVEGVIRGINGAYRMARGIAGAAEVVKETRAAIEAGKSIDEVAMARDAAVERNKDAINDLEVFRFEYTKAYDVTAQGQELGGIREIPKNADGTPNVPQLEADLKGTDAVAYSDKTPPTMTQAEQRLDPRVAAVRGSLEQLESLDEVVFTDLAAKDIDVAGLALDDELRRRMWVASEEVIRISRLPAYADQEIDIASALELLTERGQAYRESGTPVARRLQARDVYKSQYEEQLNAVSGGGTLPPDPPLPPNPPQAATQPPPASPAAPTASAAPTTAAPAPTPAAPAAAAQPATPAAPAAAAQPATPAAPAAAAQPATPAAGGTGTSAATGGTGTGAGTGRARAAARRSRIKQTQMVNVGGRLVPLSYIRAAINQRGGHRLLSLIISAATMTPHVPVSKFSRFMRTGLDMFTEMFKASILSGPRTLSTNHSGSMIAALVTQTERAIGTRIAARRLGGRVSRVLAQREGRVLMGHMNLATDTVRLLSFGAMDLPASVRNTFRQGGAPTLIPDSIISEASPGAFSPARTGLRTVKRDAQGNAMFDDLGRFEYEATGLGAALDWIGKVVGLPFRLMGTSDEMTKFRVIRENLTGILTDDVVKRNPGATADQIQQLVEAEFDKMLVDQKRLYSLAAVQEKAMRQAASEGLVQTQQAFKARVKKLVEQGDASIQFEPFDPDRAVLADMAAKRARQSTFQDDYDAIIHDPIAGLGAPLVGRIGKAAAGIVREFPAASLVLPFIKTPTNIIAFALNRNPASQVWNLLRKQIVARDPVLRAEAIGRLTTGAALYTTAVGLAAGGLITGRGPKDKEMRRQLSSTGWQPYSIKVGDSYVSFQRAEPFSMMMGLIADAVDYLNNTYEESDDDGISMSIGTAVLAALTNNLTNKTFLVGITTALNAAMNPELHGPRLLRNYAGALVPNLLTQFGPTTGDEELIEARTLLDAAMARLPWFGEAPESLDRVRNALGEPIERTSSPYLDFLNPYVVSSRRRDPVMEEMVGLRKGFGQPRRVVLGGIDLADFRNSRGQTAYDRFQEITSEIRVDGRTLRRSLMDLIKDPRFSSLPSGEVDGVDSPRVRMIRSRIDSYRKEAFDRLLREYPDLARRYQEALSTRSMMEN